jgi:hypothetical protein
MDSDMKQRV